MNVLDLFSGIGGFSLGLERAGMRTVAFCEINKYCRRILGKHWPNVPIYEDVRSLTADRLRADGIIPDVICGGFPCQDISLAGNGAGLEGARSGLWFEYARLIEEISPAWVIIENVAALRSRGLGVVLGQLSALGYDAEWHCIPAAAVGAPHRRDRLWIVAHTQSRGQSADGRAPRQAGYSDGSGEALADAEGFAQRAGLRESEPAGLGRGRSGDRSGAEHVSDTDDAGRAQQWRPGPVLSQLTATELGGWWCAEPDVGRVAYGVSNGVDRLTALGNAVVPQIPEIIGRAIIAAENGR